MKKTVKFLAIVLALFVSTYLMATNDKGDKTTKVVTFDSNMNCSACQGKVEGNLKDLSGVLSYKTNLASNTVTVKYDTEKTDSEKISKAIKDAGFKSLKRGECGSDCKKADCTVCHPVSKGAAKGGCN